MCPVKTDLGTSPLLLFLLKEEFDRVQFSRQICLTYQFCLDLTESSNISLSIIGLFLGSFGHADDIQGLQLCVDKCGTVVTGHNPQLPELHYSHSTH